MERQRIFTLIKVGCSRFAILFCLIIVSQTGVVIAAQSVVLVSIPGNAAHQRFSAAFRGKVSQLNPNVDIIEQSIDAYEPSPERLVVTLGSRAFRETTHQSGTMLHALITHALYKGHYPDYKIGKYLLVFNQSIEQMLSLYDIALPKIRNIGLLLGNPYPEIINKSKRAAENLGKKIIIEQMEDDFLGSLAKLLPQIDSLLLFPDAAVINRSTINSLVLDSYHKKIPLLGYSRSLVKAGAMLALFSTPEQLGEDSAQLVSRIISGKKVAVVNYPKQFGVSVNYKLSRVYGISIPSEKELHDQLISGRQQ